LDQLLQQDAQSLSSLPQKRPFLLSPWRKLVLHLFLLSLLITYQLAHRAGIPDGVINMITTQKHVSAVGREMCENKIVKKVSFTGSTQVAKYLYGLASTTMKK
jgi:hypothetical protein